MDLVTHVITNECEVRIVSYEEGMVCVRISEKNPNLINPTIFEISGSPQHISEALSTAAATLVGLEGQSRKEPN